MPQARKQKQLKPRGNAPQTKSKTKTKPKPKPKSPPRSSPSNRLMPRSPHAYLDPFISSGHVVSHIAAAPFLTINSVSRLPITIAANDELLICLTWTPSLVRGYYVAKTVFTVTDAVGLTLVAPQFDTLKPTHVSNQRFGMRIQNTSSAVNISGAFYSMATNDPISISGGDNVADGNFQLTATEFNSIVSRITNGSSTRITSAISSTKNPVKGLVVRTNHDTVWEDAVPNPLLGPSFNTWAVAKLAEANARNSYSSHYIYIPPQPLVQSYILEVRSQDGCRFDMDHALNGSSTRPTIVPSEVIQQLYQAAHQQSKHGELVPHTAQPQETFMSKVESAIQGVGNTAESLALAIPKVGRLAYNAVRSGQILRSLRSVPMLSTAVEGALMIA